MPSIDVRQLSKRFSDNSPPVLQDVTFAVPEGESLCLLGPSGCGKTTLLRLLMGLEEPSSGSIDLSTGVRDHMSYVFQEPRLVPWRSCLENTCLPLELTRDSRPASRERALDLLAQLGLADRLDHFPGELSGGMQMRVALARALVTQPRTVLLDEPFAALDERSRFRLQDLLLELKAELGLQFVFVTHSIAEAVYLGDHILMLDNGGRARDWGAIEFTGRDQSLKQTPAFNTLVQRYSDLFAEMESAVPHADGAGAAA